MFMDTFTKYCEVCSKPLTEDWKWHDIGGRLLTCSECYLWLRQYFKKSISKKSSGGVLYES